MIWLAYFVYYFLVLRFLVSLSNLLTRQWLGNLHSGRSIPGSGQPLVSVLIPARNEEKNICNLLEDLSSQHYENIEILVYDDLSEDNTGNLVRSCIKKDRRIKLIEGTPLPDGWTGKNHACHRLSIQAKGDYLLFLDADVRVKKSIIINSLAHLEKYRLSLLSVFPVQNMQTFGEKVTVPVMNWILTGLLPLVLTRISSRPALSAANGQFMLYRAEVYHRYRFHSEHRNSIVEDISIFRSVKRKGLPAHTVLSNGDISCRMYNSYKDAVNGFSRSVAEYFGGNLPVAALFALVTTFGFIPALVLLPAFYQFTFLPLLLLHRALISGLSRQHVLQNLLLAPVQQLSFCVIVIMAFRHKIWHNLNWKGRNVYRTDMQSGDAIKI